MKCFLHGELNNLSFIVIPLDTSVDVQIVLRGNVAELLTLRACYALSLRLLETFDAECNYFCFLNFFVLC